MKVLWLAPIPLVGDNDAHPAPWIKMLASRLLLKGIKLTILNYSSKIDRAIEERCFENIRIIYVKVPSLKIDLLTLYQIRIRIMRKFILSVIDEYELIHIHGTEHQYEVMVYGINVPTVISVQGILSEIIKIIPKIRYIKIFLEWYLSSLYEKRYIAKHNVFSCRTHWDSGCIREINPRAKVYCIWEMIRPEFFSDHWSRESRSIVFMGGSNPIKGLRETLMAFNDYLVKHELKLIILGGCKINHVHNIVEKHNLNSIDMAMIECRGMQDVEGVLRAFDESFCLVHPTYIDNSPNSICEAQLAGLPVISTNVGGVSSLIDHRVTGILINLSIEEIGESVVELYQNVELAEMLSINAKNKARKRHDPEDISSKTIKMYREVIDQ